MAEGVVAEEKADGQHVKSPKEKGAAMTYGAIISPLYAFGSTGRGRNAMCYVEGDKFMYPVGAHMSMFSSSSDEVKLMPLAEKVTASLAVTLSANQKYFAVVEEVEDSTAQVVSVYSLITGKRVKCLQLGPTTGNDDVKVTDISFSENSKFLITQCGEPDHQLLVWRWYTAKVICTIRYEKPILAACFNPVDDTLLAVAHSAGAFLTRLDGEAGNSRPVPIPAAEQTRNTITSFTWLMGNLLAFTSSRGRIQINHDAEIKAVLRVDIEDSLCCIVAKGRGFVASGQKGVLYFYDPPEPSAKRAGSTELYVLVHALNCNLPGRSITSLAMSVSEDYAAVLCSSGEMLSLSMEMMAEYEQKQLHQLLGNTHGEQEIDPFTLVGGGIGSPLIVGLDAIAHLPLVAVATADKVVRIVNYESRHCVVAKSMIDDIMCCALHPSGTMVAVGLHEKLQLFSIAQDDLGDLASFSVKKCHLARFSSGGGMLAAVGRSNTIYIYHAFNYTQLMTLKGHVSVVTCMAFSPDERRMVSVGAGGSVYFWDLAQSRRIEDSEYVDKRALYASADFGGHNGRISAVVRAGDGRLQHIFEGRVEYEVAGPKCTDRSTIALLGEDRVLLVTDDRGSILSYPWPGSFPAPPGMSRFAEAQTYRLHAPGAGAISTMVVLPQHGIVFTASSDGVVIMSRLDLVLKGQLLEPQPAPWSLSQGAAGPMVLTLPVPLERLHSFRVKMIELATLLGTTRSDAEYQSFRQSQLLRENLAKAEAELAETQKQLAEKQAELETVLGSVYDKEKAIVKELEAAHMAAADELEVLFDRRLELEAQKLKSAVAERDDVQFKLEEQMKRSKTRHENEISRLHEEHQQALNRAKAQREWFEALRDKDNAEFGEYMNQAEGDFEEATDRANAHIEQLSLGAKSRDSHLKAEVNILKRTNLRFKGEKALELKKMSKVLADNSAMREAVADGQITISKLERELQGREEVISDNFVTIQGLRRRIQELEKHKFVLTYKADAFSKELDPCKATVEALGRNLMQHESELLKARTENARLARMLDEKDAANRLLKREVDNANMRCTQHESLLDLFSVDVQAVMAARDTAGTAGTKSARERGVEELYRKYCREWNTRVKTSDQVEAELTRHLHMSEIHKELLQKRIMEGKKQGKGSKHTGLHQNMTLLRELQVATHDSKQLARTLEDEHSKLRDLSVRYRLLEARMKSSIAEAQNQLRPPDPNATAAATAAAIANTSASEPGLSPVRPKSAVVSGAVQQRQADGVVRGSPARNLAELLAQEQAGVMEQMHVVMERMVGAQSQSRLQAMAKQQAVLEDLQRSLKEQIQAEQADFSPEGSSQAASSQLPGHMHSTYSEDQPQGLQPSQGTDSTISGGTNIHEEGQLWANRKLGLRSGPHADMSRLEAGTNQQGEGNQNSPYLVSAHNAINQRSSNLGPRSRPVSASSNYTSLLNTSGPTARGNPVRRRPQSAAGVGMRAYVNSNTKAWRSEQH